MVQSSSLVLSVPPHPLHRVYFPKDMFVRVKCIGL